MNNKLQQKLLVLDLYAFQDSHRMLLLTQMRHSTLVALMRYAAHALDRSHLPMLLCCGSMRPRGFLIDMTKNCVSLPLDATATKAGRAIQWLELALHWTGPHYMLPIDKEDSHAYKLVNSTFLAG